MNNRGKGTERRNDLRLFFGRYLALVGMMVWVGGFMFYGGAVVSILDDALGSHDAGMLTRRVTNVLNAIGLTVILWSIVLAWFERRMGPRWAIQTRTVLLILTSLCLIALAALHVIMDNHLDRVGLPGFRQWHRAYLRVSTAQWLVNLGLLAIYLTTWTRPNAP